MYLKLEISGVTVEIKEDDAEDINEVLDVVVRALRAATFADSTIKEGVGELYYKIYVKSS